MEALLQHLESAVGREGLATGDAAKEQAFSPWARLGAPLAIVRPRSTEQVSAILKAAHAAGGAVVPWGGRTGLVDGASAEGAIALSLERMNAVEEIDAAGATMTVQAGCVLQA